MLKTALNPLKMTDGEQSVLLAFIGVGLLGAGMSFTIVNEMGGEGQILRPLSWYDSWMILSGLIGACVGLFLGRSCLGHGGWRGAFCMLRGGIVVTFAAAIVGGSLALPLYGTMFGPLLLGMTLWGHPILGAIWVAMLLGAHALFRSFRRERQVFLDRLPRQSAVSTPG